MAARRWRWQRDLAKERHWRRIVREWSSSGLSVREICDWQALSEPSFYVWRRADGSQPDSVEISARDLNLLLIGADPARVTRRKRFDRAGV